MGSEASNRSIVCSQLETPTRRRYCIEPIEDAALQGNPRAVWIMLIHDLLPNRDRHPVGTLFVPGNLLNLQSAIRPFVKNRPTKQEEQRHFAVFKRVKIFRRSHIQIVGAGYR